MRYAGIFFGLLGENGKCCLGPPRLGRKIMRLATTVTAVGSATQENSLVAYCFLGEEIYGPSMEKFKSPRKTIESK